MTMTRRAMAAGIAAFSFAGLSRSAQAQTASRPCEDDFKRTVRLPYKPPGADTSNARLTIMVGVSNTVNPYTSLYPGDSRNPRFYYVLKGEGMNSSHANEELLFPSVISIKPMGRQTTIAQLPLPPDHPDHNAGAYAISQSPDKTSLAFYSSSDKEKIEPYARYETTRDGFSMFYQTWNISLSRLRRADPRTAFLKISGNRYDTEAYDNFHNRPEYKMPRYALDQIDDAIRTVAEQYYQERFVNKPNGTCEENCYVSTAACGAIGLEDDCWELTQLRRFRDGWLKQQKHGADDIQRYYDLAPSFTKNVLGASDARLRLIREYWRTILPCAIFSRLGQNRLAYGRYRRMMDRLTSA